MIEYVPWECLVIYKRIEYMRGWIEDFIRENSEAIKNIHRNNVESYIFLKDGSTIKFIKYSDSEEEFLKYMKGQYFNRIYIDSAIYCTDIFITQLKNHIITNDIIGGSILL